MKRFAFLALFFVTAALTINSEAQQLQPADTYIDRGQTPSPLQVPDNSGNWVPFGAVDSTNHNWLGMGKEVYVRQFGAHNDWVSDDGPAIAAALAAANAAGGGTVYLDQKAYWNQTQQLVVPSGVELRCIGFFSKQGVAGGGFDHTNQPCVIYQKVGTSLSVGGSLTNMGVIQDTAHFSGLSTGPNSTMTRDDLENFINGFTGVGVSVTWHQAKLENLLIGGFATCLVTTSNQMQIKNILGDCTNGVDISNSYDDNFLYGIEMWEFLTVGNPHRNDHWSITGLADNGSGLIRVTISTADTTLKTGEKLWIAPGTSMQGASGMWTITVINSTTFDLQGSIAATMTPITTTGSTSFLVGAQVGYTYVPVGSTVGLAPGMNVSGPGIPTGATIGAVWRSRNAISLDQTHAATAAGTNVTLTFTNKVFDGTYTGSNTPVMFYDGNWRYGTGFAIGRADGTMCTMCFAFGYQIGFNFRGAVAVGFINAQYDQGNGPTANHLANQNAIPIGVEFTNDSATNTVAYANNWKGTNITGNGILIYGNPGPNGNNSGQTNTVEVDRFAASQQYATFIENSIGGLIVKNAIANWNGNILIDNTLTNSVPFFINNRLPLATVYSTNYQPTMYFGQSIFGGTLESKGATSLVAQRITTASAAGAAIDMYSANRPQNEKYWRWYGTGSTNSQACLQAVDDTYATLNNAMCVNRTGTTPTSITTYASTTLGGTTTTSNLVVNGTLNSTFTGGGTPYNFTASSLTSNQSAMKIFGDDGTNGGQLTLTNTAVGALTPNKSLRVANNGTFQIVNSAYTNVVFNVDDLGNAFAPGEFGTAAVSVAALPPCSSLQKGYFTFANNASSPTYLGIVSTTVGAISAPIFCNGTNWVFH